MPALLLGPVRGTAVPRRRPEWCIYVAEKQPVLEPGEGLHAPPVTYRRGTGASGRLTSPSQLTAPKDGSARRGRSSSPLVRRHEAGLSTAVGQREGALKGGPQTLVSCRQGHSFPFVGSDLILLT